MAWQGHLRAISPNYDHIVVCGPSGHQAMYDDFCDRYIPYNAPTIKANMWMNEPVEHAARNQFKFLTGTHEAPTEDAVFIDPKVVWSELVSMNKGDLVTAIQPQKFKKLGEANVNYDIVYHARNREDWDSGFRNWLPDDCEKVLEAFPNKKIACIGRSDMAHYVGGDDLRDITLSVLAEILSGSKVLLGPVSGPVHFGAICGIPEVTWCVKMEHQLRVRHKWNPFNIKVETICADDDVWRKRTPWTPDAKEIIKLTKKVLNE